MREAEGCSAATVLGAGRLKRRGRMPEALGVFLEVGNLKLLDVLRGVFDGGHLSFASHGLLGLRGQKCASTPILTDYHLNICRAAMSNQISRPIVNLEDVLRLLDPARILGKRITQPHDRCSSAYSASHRAYTAFRQAYAARKESASPVAAQRGA
jgi:hypothetical protein